MKFMITTIAAGLLFSSLTKASDTPYFKADCGSKVLTAAKSLAEISSGSATPSFEELNKSLIENEQTNTAFIRVKTYNGEVRTYHFIVRPNLKPKNESCEIVQVLMEKVTLAK